MLSSWFPRWFRLTILGLLTMFTPALVAAQEVTLTPGSLSWGNVQIGQTSAFQSVSLTNNQSTPLQIAGIALPTGSDFVLGATGCPTGPNTSIPAGGSCAFSIAFRPLAQGLRSSQVSVLVSSSSGSQSLPVQGNGIVGPVLFSPTSLTFSGVNAGASSSQSVTLTNTTGSAITLNGFKSSSQFAESDNCPVQGTLAAGASCTLNVTFSPSKVGQFSGTVQIAYQSNGSSGLQDLYLSGATPSGSVTLTPVNQDFGSETVGATTAAVSFTLLNGSNAPISISSVTSNLADFTPTSNCPNSLSTLQAGASCTIAVSFTPSTSGARTGSLIVATSASSTPLSANLTGTGVSPTGSGSLSISPSALGWGSVAIGQSSAPKSITLTNSQSSPLTISGLTVTGDFVQSSTTCPAPPATLAANASCTIAIAFRPLAQGAQSGSVSIADNATNSPQTVALSGTGVVGALLFSPTSITFPDTGVGSASAPQTVTLTNPQSAAVSIAGITITGPFAQTNTCPASLPANGACTLNVTFNPNAAGAQTGTVNVKTGTSVFQMYASGSALSSSSSGSVALSPASYNFGTVAPGSKSAAYTFTLTNGQQVALNISAISVSNASFVQSNTCPASLPAGAQCSIVVTFAPSGSGTQSGVLSVTDDAPASPQTASLTGAGGSMPSGVSLSPKQQNFGNVAIGTTATSTTTLYNNQSSVLSISSIAIGAPFTETNTCGNSVASGASCTITVNYTPTTAGYSSAVLSVTDSASGSPQSIPVTGNAVTAVAMNPKNGLYFSDQIVATSSTPQSVTLTNNMSTALTISSIATTADFPITTNCTGGSAIAPGGSCTINISFDPQSATYRSTTIAINDNAPGSPQSIPVQGNGIPANPGVIVNVSPYNPCVLPSTTQQFSAIVSNTSNTGVRWYVDNVYGGNSTTGTITQGGLYTAPPGTGTHSIKAASVVSGGGSGTSTINVTTSPVFTIYPFKASVPVGGQQTFQAQVCSVPDTNPVTYTVDGIAGGNATVGTITSDGVYTGPATGGSHQIKVTDSAINRSSTGVATVFAGITADFGGRTNTVHPIPANLFGADRIEALHTPSDVSLMNAAGITISRTYAQIPTVYATQTPNWTKIDPLITMLYNAGIHPILQISFSPPWLQPNPNPCGAGNTAVPPTDVNAWAQIAASYVAHMDAKFPGFVQYYEIWNEPDAASLCTSKSHLSTYLSIYAAAAPAMKAQAAADGATIYVGGPALASATATNWITSLTTNASTAPYVDFVSYHQYLFGKQNLEVQWDTYNGSSSVYQRTQDPSLGAAAYYTKVENWLAAGKQPLGAKTPVFIDEYNTNWAFFQECCRNSPVYAPVWNALYVADLFNTVYSGNYQVPGSLVYFAATAYPYFCLIGTQDQNMDCEYSEGSSPQPYPQYYIYQLISSPNYLGLEAGGYMAASANPPDGGGGIVVTAFYDPTQDAILIVNPTANSFSQVQVTAQNTGYTGTPHATLYQIVNGTSINSSSLGLTQQGSGFTGIIDVPPYSVQAVSLRP